MHLIHLRKKSAIFFYRAPQGEYHSGFRVCGFVWAIYRYISQKATAHVSLNRGHVTGSSMPPSPHFGEVQASQLPHRMSHQRRVFPLSLEGTHCFLPLPQFYRTKMFSKQLAMSPVMSDREGGGVRR